MANPEQLSPKQEKNERLQAEVSEKSEHIRNTLEKTVATEKKADKHEAMSEARRDAVHEALSVNDGLMRESQQSSEEPFSVKRVSKAKKTAIYKSTLQEIQKEMPTTERTFSKVIHNPAVERTSEVAGNTLFRPNAILGAGVCAFLLSGALYILARHFGYALSGFETIGALVVGFVLGLLYDFLKAMVTGKRS